MFVTTDDQIPNNMAKTGIYGKVGQSYTYEYS